MTSTRPWLVVGGGGMLGRELVGMLGERAVGLDLPDLDITSPASVGAALADVEPAVVVNCAAYTAVDRAEVEEETAELINGYGPRVLAEACAGAGRRLPLLHVSTDYVFAGDAGSPYGEDDPTDPRTAYGRTKRHGEVAVREVLPSHSWVLRTAWLYGEHGPNFVATMLRLEQERDVVEVVDDQHGQPTWARDLAARIIDTVDLAAPPGTYHATSSGSTTWWALAREVFRLAGADPDRVRPISSEAFAATRSASAAPTAPRPAWSVLGHDGWARAGLAPMREWSAALRDAVPDAFL